MANLSVPNLVKMVNFCTGMAPASITVMLLWPPKLSIPPSDAHIPAIQMKYCKKMEAAQMNALLLLSSKQIVMETNTA